jgi:hypothetical protein
MANEHNHLEKKHPPKVQAKGIYFLEHFILQVLHIFFLIESTFKGKKIIIFFLVIPSKYPWVYWKNEMLVRVGIMLLKMPLPFVEKKLHSIRGPPNTLKKFCVWFKSK